MKLTVNVYELSNGIQVVLNGTIEDVRIYMKNLYNPNKYFIDMSLCIGVEEEYYCYLDNDNNLLEAINKFGYKLKELCLVPIEDFQD